MRVTTARKRERKIKTMLVVQHASVKGRALLRSQKDRVLLLQANGSVAQELNTQGGASAQEDHSAKVMGALPT